ncbi:DUF3099 domain-containing protein [Corynebacterium uterequi]|uniref:Putative DUF3099 family protein n=1 Tax=Corynebacterium uterequi TaxID=1072256 RepID=A0A0G3HEW9_9CORY|nr:DUF3099 domain-containing protein [Corynebacterium uterequi]AKK11270.1 putative DUF3099 family protein [Corynebacterium uterequi]
MDADPRNGRLSARWRPFRRPSQLITSAPQSSHQQRAHRRKWYLIVNLSRVPLLVLCGVAFWVWDNVWLTVVLFILAVPTPLIAVVFANEKNPKKDPRMKGVYKPAVARAQQEWLEQHHYTAISAPVSEVIDHVPDVPHQEGPENR